MLFRTDYVFCYVSILLSTFIIQLYTFCKRFFCPFFLQIIVEDVI